MSAHVLIEECATRPAGCLGAVHGGVGIPDNLGDRLVSGGTEGDTNTDGAGDRTARNFEGLPELIANARGDSLNVLDVRQSGEEHGELVATKARHQIAGIGAARGSSNPRTTIEALGGGDQQLVAGRMPQAVVD